MTPDKYIQVCVIMLFIIQTLSEKRYGLIKRIITRLKILCFYDWWDRPGG